MIGPLILVAMIAALPVMVWRVRYLSPEEKAFATYAQSEAKKHNMKREHINQFMYVEMSYLHEEYEQAHGKLEIKNITRLLCYIHDTYRE